MSTPKVNARRKLRYIIAVTIFFSVLAVGVSTAIVQNGNRSTANSVNSTIDEFHLKTLARQWENLLTRCRNAVENGIAIDKDGLSEIALSDEEAYQWKYKYGTQSDRWRVLGKNGARFAIIEQESKTWDNYNRNCVVDIAPGQHPLTLNEEAYLLRALIHNRARAISLGTHEALAATIVFPSMTLAFGPKENNPSNCKVIIATIADQKSLSFRTTVGEQLINGPCGGPSFF
ncbi:hypothetical protein ACTL6U_20625 [Rhodovibrionaceae bacterium A322]